MTEWLDVEMNACGGVGNNSSYNLELINVVQQSRKNRLKSLCHENAHMPRGWKRNNE